MSDPRVPAREQVVLRYVLDRFAADRPDTVFLQHEDGTSLTYGEVRELTRDSAHAFQQLGVRQGDHVVSYLPNGLDALRVWFGLNYLGAVYVPINPAYRGNLLSHVIRTADASLLVVHATLAENLRGVALGAVKEVLELGGASAFDGLRRHDGSLLDQSGDPKPPETPIEPWHIQGIWYTSGTTGPSKGVLSSYLHAYSMFGPETFPFIDETDRYMINLPLFHMGGTGLLNSMLLRGGSVSFVETFSTSRFLTSVRDTGSTVVFLLGVMAAFLDSRPKDASDADNPLRTVFVIPVLDDMLGFAARFGVDVYSIFNMTEINSPIVTAPNSTVAGTCGRLRPGCEVRLVDENDLEVSVGEVGEFVVRSDTPWSMNSGYYAMPEATARAWRNGWFHTGDAGRRDTDGNFFFVDRLKDAIRRRGEFVSSLELEIEICAHPDVRTAAVIGVPSEFAEEELLAVVVPVEGREPSVESVIDFLRPRVATFMLPRYVRFADDLPMTPTEKVRKTVLREIGAAGAHDRGDRPRAAAAPATLQRPEENA